MGDTTINPLPFITREALRTGNQQPIQLRITTQGTGDATVTVTVVSREGISKFTQLYVGTGLAQTSTFNVTDIPIYVSVVDASGTLIQGNLFCTLNLVISGEIVTQLCAGLVYRQKGISWPVSITSDVIPGRGGYRVVNGVNQAAGNEIGDAVPGGQMWRLLWVRFNLVTDATAANRRVHLVLGGSINNMIEAYGSSDQTASTTRFYSFAPYGTIPDETDSSSIIISMPSEIFLVGNEQIITTTTNLQAGDNFGAAEYGIEQLFEQDA